MERLSVISMAEVDLTIPDFLLVTPAEAERRKRHWEEHPPTAVNFSGATDEKLALQREAREQEKKDRLAALAEATKAKRAQARGDAEAEQHGKFSQHLPGTDWNPSVGKFTPRNYMSPSKYARLRAEMPTEAHRAAFDKIYGAGPPDSVAETSAATRGKAEEEQVPRSAPRKARSALPGAGRDGLPDAPPVDRRPGSEARPGSQQRAQGAPVSSPSDAVARVAAMLTRPEGASLTELAAVGAGGKLPHSCSAFLTTKFRQKGAVISKTKDDKRGGWVYHLDKEPSP